MNRARTPLVGLAALVLAILFAAPAWACSCIALTPAEHAERGDLVARVAVSGIDTSAVKGFSGDPVRYTLTAHTVWKGPKQAEYLVTSAVSSATCGLELSMGDDVVLFARADGDGWTATTCDGTAPATPTLVADVEQALGAGQPAVATSPSAPATNQAPATSAPPTAAGVPTAVLWMFSTLVVVALAVIVLAAVGPRQRR